MKKYILTLLTFCSATFLYGQAATIKPAAATQTMTTATYLGTFQPEESDPILMPEIKGLTDHINKSVNEEYVQRYKDSLDKIKRAALPIDVQSSSKTTASIDPVKVSGFGTTTSQSTPMDNTVAIGKNGFIIAAHNSALRIYNKNGTAQSAPIMFTNFWSSVTGKNSLCDPLVYFDPKADRFIVFTQICDRSTLNNVVFLAFSTTNDPAGSYHYYSFRTNLREVIGTSYPVDTWFDYPKMAVSKSDVFVTGNMFANVSATQSTYVESVILQVDKNACYAGQTNPTAQLFNNITGDPFTLVPAGHGRDDDYGDVMHFAATNRVSTTGNIKMYTVTNNVNNNPIISTADVAIPAFGIPANGLQPGTNFVLNTGDNRGMSAMYVDGTVHFVFHSDGPGNYVAINYNRLRRSGNTWVAQNKLISFPNIDCGYPSVASMGYTNQDQSALIVYDYSSATNFPGVRAVFVDNNMNVSNAIELQSGVQNVQIIDQIRPGQTRWGDYTGISREHNASTPTVWGFGMWGNANGTWSNYVSEIKTSAWPVSIKDEKVDQAQSIELYPNPIVDSWSIKLDIVEAGKLDVLLYDLNGKKIRNLHTANVSKGRVVFSFNKNGLSTGTYVVKIVLNNSTIGNEKIIVSK